MTPFSVCRNRNFSMWLHHLHALAGLHDRYKDFQWSGIPALAPLTRRFAYAAIPIGDSSSSCWDITSLTTMLAWSMVIGAMRDDFNGTKGEHMWWEILWVYHVPRKRSMPFVTYASYRVHLHSFVSKQFVLFQATVASINSLRWFRGHSTSPMMVHSALHFAYQRLPISG